MKVYKELKGFVIMIKKIFKSVLCYKLLGLIILVPFIFPSVPQARGGRIPAPINALKN